MPSNNRLSSWNVSPQNKNASNAKFIFVSGGVMSAVGKGVTAASIAMLLQKHGYRVTSIKCENNLNVDFGTINPIEHGDPFLCFDGLEADIDLGNYERFLEQEVGHPNFMTMGELYQTVIKNERSMKYEGEDVEPIPHITNEITRRFYETAEKTKADFVVIELGGTVGEYENNNGLYYEAARRMAFCSKVAHVHVTYVPIPPHIGEPKTKPAQFGIKSLMTMGILPDFLVIRSEEIIDDQRRYKFAYKFDINPENVFSDENLDVIEEVPLHLLKQKLDLRILKFFKMKAKKKIDISAWEKYVNSLKTAKKRKVKVAIVGKYFSTGKSTLTDSYYALIKALEHASVFHEYDLELSLINSEIGKKDLLDKLEDVDGIVVPIGWGARGVDGKIEAVKFARENKIPYLGLCYGMQLACVEFARNVAGLKDAHSVEVDPKTKHKIIHKVPFNRKYQVIKGDGCSMRLGSFDCILKKGTVTYKSYKKHKGFKNESKSLISERHRHRFEFNNKYREILSKNGLVFSGTSPDGYFVEFVELPRSVHPFFVGTQGHPEYKSRPLAPHPLFIDFLKAGIEKGGHT